MSIPIPRRGLPMIFNIFRKNKVSREVEPSFTIDNDRPPKKTIYEKIENLELEIESKLGGLELTFIEPNKLDAFKEQYKNLKEEANKQVIREKDKDKIELYLKDCNYYQKELTEFLENLDAALAKYTFLKRVKEFKIDSEDINLSIKEVFYLRNDYISLNILFSDIEKDSIDLILSNIYLEIILIEIRNSDDSLLFKELSLVEKKNVQLALMKRIRDSVSKTKFKKEHLEELMNIAFTLDIFRTYLRLLKKYSNPATDFVSTPKVMKKIN